MTLSIFRELCLAVSVTSIAVYFYASYEEVVHALDNTRRSGIASKVSIVAAVVAVTAGFIGVSAEWFLFLIGRFV
jgi:hypothetical protein